MLDICRRLKMAIRYWMFPESQLIDRRTEEIDHQRRVTKLRVGETRQIVSHATQPDTLRNLVAAMTSDKDGRRAHDY